MPAARRSRTIANSRVCSRSVRDAVGIIHDLDRQPRPTAQAISTSCVRALKVANLRSGRCLRRPLEPLLRSPALRTPVDAPPRAGLFQTQRDVFRDAQVRKEGGLLVNAREAQCASPGRRKVIEQLAVQRDRPVVGPMHSHQHFDQRRFARAVSRATRATSPLSVQTENSAQGAHARRTIFNQRRTG